MKAMVLTDVCKFTYMDVDTPMPKAGEVQINIKAVSICGSDVHGYDGSSGRRIPPIICGHEASGMISALGEGVTGFKVGDHVVFNSMLYCGTCWSCQRAWGNLCENGMCHGVNLGGGKKLEGAMCEYITVPEYIVYQMPDNMSFEEAALVEPAAIACHAVDGTPIALDDTVAVFGSGTIGLMLLKLLKNTSASRVIIVDIDDAKLETAKSMGADVCLNSRACDTVTEIKKLTHGRGADVSFEAVGISATVLAAVECLRKRGRLTLVGNVTPKVEIPLQTIVFKELELAGRCYTYNEYEKVLSLVGQGKLTLSDCISLVAPLKDAQQYFDRLHAAEPGLLKIVLTP